MKKVIFDFILLFTISSFIFLACNNKKVKETQIVDMHTSENSLDWSGTYSGNIPCADCDQIETTLVLNKDLTYTLLSKYIGKEKEIEDTLFGKFVWDKNNIRLEGIPDKSKPKMFKVEENQVRQLDMEGNEITGELASMYVLSKIGNPSVEDKRWQLIELFGNAILGKPESHYIIFHSKESSLEAKANCNVLRRSYKIRNQFQIKIDQGITTLMACPDGIEDDLLKALDQTDNISTDGKFLSLNKARMAPLARFELKD